MDLCEPSMTKSSTNQTIWKCPRKPKSHIFVQIFRLLIWYHYFIWCEYFNHHSTKTIPIPSNYIYSLKVMALENSIIYVCRYLNNSFLWRVINYFPPCHIYPWRQRGSACDPRWVPNCHDSSLTVSFGTGDRPPFDLERQAGEMSN